MPLLGVLHPPLPLPMPAPGPLQHNDPFRNNFAPALPVYQHLPPHLAQAVAQLPPLPVAPRRGRGHGRGHIQEQNHPANLAQAAAALPPLPVAPLYGRRPIHYIPPPIPNLPLAPLNVSDFYIILIFIIITYSIIAFSFANS